MNGKLDNIHPDLMALLTALEVYMGFQLMVVSGQRTEAHNAKVGGVKKSEHTYMPAKGADVLCTRASTRYKMLEWLFAHHVKRIGIGKEFLHVGIAADKPQERAWHYYPEV